MNKLDILYIHIRSIYLYYVYKIYFLTRCVALGESIIIIKYHRFIYIIYIYIYE